MTDLEKKILDDLLDKLNYNDGHKKNVIPPAELPSCYHSPVSDL